MLEISADKNKEELSLVQISSHQKTNRWIMISIVIVISMALFAIGAIFLINSLYNNDGISKLIPQPFIENNDFMIFKLRNKLQVVLIKPNSQLNNTHICKIISSFCWSWFSSWFERLQWIHSSDWAHFIYWIS